MGRRFRFDYKSPVVNPDEYLNQEREANRCVCLSLRDIHIITAYLWPFTSWPTRFSRPVSIGVREESTPSEYAELQEDLDDLSARLGEAKMGNCYDGMALIAAALEHAASVSASASASASCCGGGAAGAGQHSPPYSEVSTPDPGVGDPPVGFESWEQFFASKCSVATDIVNNLIVTWGRYNTINLVGMTLVSLLPVLISLAIDPIPGDELAVVGGVLLVSLGLGNTLIGKVIDTLNAHKDELICVLYNADSAAVASSEFVSNFSDFWTSDGNDALLGLSASTAIAAMVGSTATNRLFTLDTTRELPAGDCSGCDEGCNPELSLFFGTGDLTLNGEVRTLTAELYPGNGLYYVRIVNASSDPCCAYYLEQVSNTGDLPRFEFNVFGCDEAIVWEQNWFFGTAPNASNVYGSIDYPGELGWGASVPFTIDVILDVAH